MKLRICALLGVLAMLVGAPAAAADPVAVDSSRGGWESAGPNSVGGLLGVSGTTLAMVQPAPPVLWLSDDRGASWTARRALPQDTAVSGFFVDPADPNRMLVLVNRRVDAVQWLGALLATTDRGQSWETRREWFPGGAFQLATDGRTVAVMNLDAMSVSTDGGVTWREDVPRTWPRDGIAAPVGDRRLALVGPDAYFTTVHPEYSLWAVRDVAGKAPRAERVYHPDGDLGQLAADGRQLVVTAGAELRGSADGGRTWATLRRDPGGEPLREPAFVGGRLYASTYQHVDVSTDGGRQWTRRPVPAAGEGVTDIAELPAGGGKPAAPLFSATYRGVFADAGAAGYRQLGVPGETMRHLVAAGYPGRQRLVAAGVQEVFDTALPQGRITPETRVWQWHTGDRLHENASLSVAPWRPEVVWQATKNGFNTDVLRSGDSGRTWQLTGKPLEGQPRAILTHPANPDRLLVSVFTFSGNALWRTEDAGRHWEKVPAEAAFSTLAGDPWHADRVWAGNNDGLWRSDDGGRTWTRVSEDAASTVTVRPWGQIVVGGNGIRLSDDNGRTFRRVHEGGRIGQIVAHPWDPRTWFAASTSGEGVLRSTDFGRTWSALPGALPDPRVLSLAVSGDGRYLFAGTLQSGVYRKTL
ncbi:sialidase family protein [Amycolatopsis anabasis]|uniref:sialidase family protein n=1 Tax=Amycolatopsis anabasis TaxID=1840409 RepID=UPI001FEB0824|nr:sialidase family protein [Amycolatopsis anabasis]